MLIAKDERVGAVIWLICAVAVAGMGFWYPEHVANRNAGPDERFGFVLLAGIPFYILGAGIAVRAMVTLFMIARAQQTRRNQFLFLAGAIMTVFSVAPLFVVGTRLLR